jgi:hypothetical protein
VPGGILSDISCTLTAACTAVGGGRFVDGRGAVPLVERWDGRKWSRQPAPAASAFSSVSCPSSRVCMAVGVADSSGLLRAERWNGSSWSRQPIATPDVLAQSDTAVTDLSCSSVTACVAVGSWGDDECNAAQCEGQMLGLWNGVRWSVRVSHGSFDGRFSVSCVSATWCVAAGDGGMQHWNGKRWSDQPTPLVFGGDPPGVSCVSKTACVAVGGGAARWNGRRWIDLGPFIPPAA